MVAPDSPEGTAHLRCEVRATPGAMAYQFALHQAHFGVTNGTQYDLRFVARADSARSVFVTITAPEGGGLRLRGGNRLVPLEPRWTVHDFRVTVENVDTAQPTSKLVFFLQSGTAGVVEFDDVRLRAIP